MLLFTLTAFLLTSFSGLCHAQVKGNAIRCGQDDKSDQDTRNFCRFMFTSDRTLKINGEFFDLCYRDHKIAPIVHVQDEKCDVTGY
ncbi:hypothetical protein TUN199_10702 [Pyrenophora tritici-repentis]|uniref:Uncharacterized protein n=1 Tax=Pyrenophora tritici-repentis TaxID=45151 RepID=A0A5M9LM32_9PLEO|nr:hypothetical protein PtrV1_04953 [Pyrenophora tritici-repentis]KAF7452657.1 hypothetical protein A1F99_044350 [Pyrenophora tritici-repentis]KAF7574205.1 hypothetical protein PtrM4_058280 [Pyrenophora tritici-repentis]KAI0571700.1 hypothetical protein Alg130_10783 [Pyrenophora tritici-repentis]KAI0584144.1 hypothetical protein Alg215_03215 [Pyrenophora tritici-repentis]